MQTQHYQDNYS